MGRSRSARRRVAQPQRQAAAHSCALRPPSQAEDARQLRGSRVRIVSFPPPARWRRPNSEGAGCGRRKPGCCLGEASGEGPGATGRSWRDAVPGKRRGLPVRKVKYGAAFSGLRQPLCTPPGVPVPSPLCPLPCHPRVPGTGASAAAAAVAAEAGAVSRRKGNAQVAPVLLAAK